MRHRFGDVGDLYELTIKQKIMSTFTIPNVSGLPVSFRKDNTIYGNVTLLGQVTCYNEQADDNDDDNDYHHHKPKKNILYIVAKVHIDCSGYEYTARSPIQVRVSGKTKSGNDISGNANELSNGLLIKPGNNNTDHEFVFQCEDRFSGGIASELVQVRFSFIYDAAAWSPC